MEQGSAAALKSGDQLLEELRTEAQPTSGAPTMGNLKKVSYTHEGLIELMIEKPWMDQNHLAAHFGYTPSWISNILAADSFQARLAARREEIIDPVLKASLEERFRALAIQSLHVLQMKLEKGANCSDEVALRAAALGAKAAGIGGFGAQLQAPGPAAPGDRLERLAARLVALQSNVRERTLDAKDGVSVEILQQADSA
jgi:hypothetical protein